LKSLTNLLLSFTDQQGQNTSSTNVIFFSHPSDSCPQCHRSQRPAACRLHQMFVWPTDERRYKLKIRVRDVYTATAAALAAVAAAASPSLGTVCVVIVQMRFDRHSAMKSCCYSTQKHACRQRQRSIIIRYQQARCFLRI